MSNIIAFSKTVFSVGAFGRNTKVAKRVGLQNLLQSRKKSTAPKWSYCMGPSETPLLGLTVGGAVDRAADMFGDNEAIVSLHQGIRKTFSQVKKESEQLAAGLLALGFEPGDRLGIWGPNSYEWYLTEMAAGKAGLILVNINPSYRPEELKYCLNKVQVKGIICAESFKTSNYYNLLTDIVPKLPSSEVGQLNSPETPDLKIVISMSKSNLRGAYSFHSLLDAGGSEEKQQLGRLESKLQFDDPCNIQFTSGTTGLPKGALLSHHNIINNAYFVGKRCNYDLEPLSICVPVPLYHCFGCVIGVLGGALFGCTTVFSSEGFDPKAIVQSFRKEKMNSCYGTPTMFVDILKEFHKNPFDMGSFSSGIMAGAPCPEELVNDVIKDLNMKKFIVMYGMTETSPVTLQCYPSDPPTFRSTTVGFPLDHTEAKVVDENERICPINEPGELWIRGYCNFLGYWKDDAKTAEVFTRERWFKTGDKVTMNENGYASIIGRIKDMIIRGGENIYPAEIENFYMGHPDIVEAQVFGVPDYRMGEEVAMWVRLKTDSTLEVEKLKEWSKGKIAHYKIPRYVLVKTEFPVTVTGKIQKFKMREATIEELNLKS